MFEGRFRGDKLGDIIVFAIEEAIVGGTVFGDNVIHDAATEELAEVEEISMDAGSDGL